LDRDENAAENRQWRAQSQRGLPGGYRRGRTENPLGISPSGVSAADLSSGVEAHVETAIRYFISARAKEPLREGGDETNLDHQADDCFGRRQHGQRIIERHTAGEEAAPVKGGDAEDQGAERREV
jgi:hypothetical protein